jgi:hypothetical protein
MRDPQNFANVYVSQTMHLHQANPKGAFMYERGLFAGSGTDVKKQLNMATGDLPVNNNSMYTPSGKPRWAQLTSNVDLRDAEKIIALSFNAISESVGMGPYGIGNVQDLKRTSGEAVRETLASSSKTQAGPFDSLSLFRKMVVRLDLGFTNSFIDRKLIENVVGSEDLRFLEALRSNGLQDEYNIVVQEVPYTPNEKREMHKAMMENQVIPQLIEIGIPPPPEFAEGFPFDPDVIKSLKAGFQKVYEYKMTELEVAKLRLEVEAQQLVAQSQQPQQMQQPQGGEQAPPPQQQPPAQ